jgi:hypothetical protein
MGANVSFASPCYRPASTTLISGADIHAVDGQWQLPAQTDKEGDVTFGPELSFIQTTAKGGFET